MVTVNVRSASSPPVDSPPEQAIAEASRTRPEIRLYDIKPLLKCCSIRSGKGTGRTPLRNEASLLPAQREPGYLSSS
jgi:hypothetical protein